MRQPGESDSDRSARASHPSQAGHGDPLYDLDPDDPLDAEIVDLVLRELNDGEGRESPAEGATVHQLERHDLRADDESEIYDYEDEGARPAPATHRHAEPVDAASTGSIASTQSAGSIASVGSVGGIASIGSAGSIASAMSAGSIASALSAGSIASLTSVGSLGSIFSVGSYRSILSIGSRNSILSIGAVDGFLTIGRGSKARSFGRR